MRLFTGIGLPAEVIRNLGGLLEQLKPTADIKWTALENLHVTTKFIGSWPEERLAELEAALASVPRPGPLAIAVRNLGFFPNARSPRVFWAGIEASPGLAALAGATDAALARLGIEPEKRGYSPHLTLARIKAPVRLAELQRQVARIGNEEFGEFSATRFCLYESRPRPSGSVYTKISEFPLE
jgi:2'-5' RNA ligase